MKDKFLAFIAIIGLILVASAAGGLDSDSISVLQCIIQSLIGFGLIFGVAYKFEATIFNDNQKKETRKQKNNVYILNQLNTEKELKRCKNEHIG